MAVSCGAPVSAVEDSLGVAVQASNATRHSIHNRDMSESPVKVLEVLKVLEG